MNTPEEVLAEARRLGIEISVRDGAEGPVLNVEPRDAITVELEEAIRRFREELIEHLRPSESPNGDSTASDSTASAQLVGLAQDVELFHAPDGDTAFATIPIDDHQETWPVNSRRFRGWLRKEFFATTRRPPRAQTLADAVALLEAQAQFKGTEHPVHLRVAGDDSVIFLDLSNPAWEAVEITAAGWQIVPNPSVKFRRTRGMRSLPHPERGGSIDLLWRFVNLQDRDQQTLLVAYLAAVMRPRGPYPVLHLAGESGSAKSTAAEVVRRLTDPNVSPLRAEPRDLRDLAIAASNNWCLALDNISYVQPWLSDALCRLSTGGGFSTRELYSDADEVILDAMRPVILTGIDEVVTRTDLIDRTLVLTLPVIPDGKRRAEAEFWASFEAARAHLLGALLDAVSGALRHLPDVTLRSKPRMADFALWATAVERALRWRGGRFLRAYTGNREGAHQLALEASPIGAPLRALVRMSAEGWSGTAAELLAELTPWAQEQIRRGKTWPRNARALRGALSRLAPTLRACGFEVTLPSPKDREAGTGRRIIRLRQTELEPSRPSSPRVAPQGRDDRGDGDGRPPTDNGAGAVPPEAPAAPRPADAPGSPPPAGGPIPGVGRGLRDQGQGVGVEEPTPGHEEGAQPVQPTSSRPVSSLDPTNTDHDLPTAEAPTNRTPPNASEVPPAHPAADEPVGPRQVLPGRPVRTPVR